MITVKGKVQLKMGAPACSHILYGCCTQNNFLDSDTVLKTIPYIIFSSSYKLLAIILLLAHLLMRCAGAPL